MYHHFELPTREPKAIFGSSSKCDFWISHPTKFTHTKFQDQKMTRTIVITENKN